MHLFLNSRVITLAMLASLAPFAIDTYLPAFHIIADDFFTSPESIQQSLTFYLVPYTIMTLFHGAISDTIGRIRTIQWGLALFFVASIGCALSTSIELLWFFRALQGLGGGAGNVVAVSAYQNDGNGADSGHVRAYQFQSGAWTQLGPDIDGASSGELFGSSLDLDDVGSRLIVGAPKNSNNGQFSGNVRIFDYNSSSSTWTLIGSINGLAAGDGFGSSVAINKSGNTIVVGAYQNDGNGSQSDIGQVRVFRKQAQNWVQLGQSIQGENSGDLFGRSVDINDAGDTTVSYTHLTLPTKA